MAQYWQMDKNDIIKEFETNLQKGLAGYKVKELEKKFGKNFIPDKDRRTWAEILFSQFANPFIYILIACTVLSFILGDIIEAITILSMILISGLLSFYQEYRSEKALQELNKFLTSTTTVLRNNETLKVDTKELVPGDIVLLHIGDIVPADMRILECEEFTTNESVLTGESKDVEKTSNILLQIGTNTPEPQDLANYVFMGTTVSHGNAKCIVISTGKNTFFGKTVNLFSAKVPESDFQYNITKFSAMLMWLIIIVTTLVFVVNTLIGHGVFDSLLFALAYAVGITPEILPVIITICLSIGALHMAKKRVVTKKLASLEDFGSMDILCMDKTGTLTEDKLILEKAEDISGIGSSLHQKNLLVYGYICDAAEGHGNKARGNIFDLAILDYASKHNEIVLEGKKFDRLEDIEFDFTRKRMSVVVSAKDEKFRSSYLLITKGEPESVLSVCTKYNDAGTIKTLTNKIDDIRLQIKRYANQGYSVLALASKPIVSQKEYFIKDENDLILQGFLLFSSIPKKDVKQSLLDLQKLGVELKILTGDDPLVTEKLCRDVGFKIKDGVVLGRDLENISDVELCRLVEKSSIFARVVPEQKLRIIEALRQNGHVVGYLGDGVNDAPSLRTANVGISVDKAVDVARDASSIVLTKKGLEVIVDGVKEGRKIFLNINKYITNTISANFGNMSSLALMSFFLPFLPLLPSQILLNNFLSDGPMTTISTDNVDANDVEKPKKWNLKYIAKFMIFFGLISSIFDIITMLFFLFVMPLPVAAFRTVWFLESLFSEIMIAFSLRTHGPIWKSRPSNIFLFSSIGVIAGSFLIVFSPIGYKLFEFTSLSMNIILIIFSILFGYLILTEILKYVFYKYIEKHIEQ